MAFKLFGETLRKIAQSFNFWDFFAGEKKTSEWYDNAQLKKAYRELQFIGPVVDLGVSFIFGNYFKIISDDENASELLNDFWEKNRALMIQAGIEGGLYGNTYLGFEYNINLLMKLLSPSSTKIIFNKEKPWLMDGIETKITVDNTEVRQIIKPETYQILVNGTIRESGPNPYNFIPIVHIVGTRFSDELYGTGAVDSALFKTAERYDELLEKTLLIEKYHAQPIPVFGGVKDFSDLKIKLESRESAELGFGISLPNEKAWVKFLELTRNNTNSTDLLKILFWDLVSQSRLAEYVFGVHMTSAQASTQEQRVLIEGTINKRRLSWTQGILEANSMILKMLEYHLGKSFKTYDTDIIWGPIFEEDKVQVADVLDKKSKSITLLKEMGIISMDTARKSLPEIIDNPETEAEKIIKEQTKENDYQKNNPENQPAETE